MARKPRSYVRKIKGCHQCLKRRINCDRAEPSCAKCVSKGIACSGLGFNYRFRNGLPSKLREGEQGNAQHHEGSSSQNALVQATSTENWIQFDEEYALGETLCDESQPSLDWDNFSSPPNSPGTALTAALPYTSTWNDFLLTYFSENICPEMVVLDDGHNGWRQQILPIACADEMVLKCVLSVSSFHLSQRAPNQIIIRSPREHFLQAIGELQSRRCLDQCDLQTKRFVIVAIILLLAAVMVNGCSDFRILFHMLQSALDSIGGEEGLADGELASFLRREIHKMRVYGAPFISPDIGRTVLQAQAKNSFDCLQYYGRLHPTHSQTFQLITSLRQQAYWIYLQRAAAGTETGTSVPVNAVESFISDLDKLTITSLGENTLVWAAFIVASESEVPSHRMFLEQFLRRQYERNGFGNISKALELLQRIWKRKDFENWTGLLHEPGVFIM